MSIEELTAEELAAELQRRKDVARYALTEERRVLVLRIAEIDRELGYPLKGRKIDRIHGKATALDSQVIAAVQAGSHSRAEIAKALGVEPMELRHILPRLVATEYLVASGSKSGRRYHA